MQCCVCNDLCISILSLFQNVEEYHFVTQLSSLTDHLALAMKYHVSSRWHTDSGTMREYAVAKATVCKLLRIQFLFGMQRLFSQLV